MKLGINITTDKNDWKEIKRYSDFPLWLMAEVYRRKYPDKKCSTDESIVIHGKEFMYKIEFKNVLCAEVAAKIDNLKVYKRKKNR